MSDLNIVDRLEECKEYGFDDLIVDFNGIMQSVLEVDVPMFQVKAELIHWCYNVDKGVDDHRKERETTNQLTADYMLHQTREVFGTEV